MIGIETKIVHVHSTPAIVHTWAAPAASRSIQTCCCWLRGLVVAFLATKSGLSVWRDLSRTQEAFRKSQSGTWTTRCAEISRGPRSRWDRSRPSVHGAIGLPKYFCSPDVEVSGNFTP